MEQEPAVEEVQVSHSNEGDGNNEASNSVSCLFEDGNQNELVSSGLNGLNANHPN